MIVDVEPSRSILSAEVGASRTMLDRVKNRFDLQPESLIADTAYGSAKNLCWLVEYGIAPHIPVIHCPAVHVYMRERGPVGSQGWNLVLDRLGMGCTKRSIRLSRRPIIETVAAATTLIQTVGRAAKVSPGTER